MKWSYYDLTQQDKLKIDDFAECGIWITLFVDNISINIKNVNQMKKLEQLPEFIKYIKQKYYEE